MMAGNSEGLERIRRQLAAVTAERDKLLAENRRLRHEFSSLQKANPTNQSDLASTTSSPSVAGSGVINVESSLPERVKLFRFGVKIYPSEDFTYIRMCCGLNITEPRRVSCYKISIASPKL